MGKLKCGLLSIKGFCNIGAGEAEQDSTYTRKHAANTHDTTINYLPFLEPLCGCASPCWTSVTSIKTWKSNITWEPPYGVWRLTGNISLRYDVMSGMMSFFSVVFEGCEELLNVSHACHPIPQSQGSQAYIISCGHNGIFAKQQHIVKRRRACLMLHQPLTLHQDGQLSCESDLSLWLMCNVLKLKIVQIEITDL